MSTFGGVSSAQLKSVVERIEQLEQEKAALAEDLKEIYAEARGNGFDTKTLRHVVKIRKMDVRDRTEQEEMLDLYLSALGMIPTSSPASESMEKSPTYAIESR